MDNLLENPGFESHLTSRWALVIEEDGVDLREIDSIHSPEGWTTWFDHRGDFRQPEVKLMRLEYYPERVNSAMGAVKLFTFNRKHCGGFFQTVRVRPGSRLRAGAWAHAWSNHEPETQDDERWFPHPDDPFWSEGAGYACVKWLDHEIEPLNGDRQSDATGNFAFSVGIDPTGGTDPRAATVLWGEPAAIYNCFKPLEPIEAVAMAYTVTLFLRSQTMWAFKHNDAYWDDVYLIDEGPADDRRVDYEILVRVPAQDVESYRRVAKIGETGLNSLVPSHDDAGRLADVMCPSGDGGRVILYDIPQGQRPAYRDYYAQRYPLARVAFADDGGGPWDIDVSDQLPRRYDVPQWPTRELSEIDRITNHHMDGLAEDLETLIARVNAYLYKEEGRPAYCYTLLVRRNGEVVKCLPLTEGCWHDHSGRTRRHLSVCLTGRLHQYPPTPAQMAAMVKINAWVIRHPEMSVTYSAEDRSAIRGHMDYIRTDCPGWASELSEYWESWFFAELDAEMGIEPLPAPSPGPVHLFGAQQQRYGIGRDEFIARVKPPAWMLIQEYEDAQRIKQLSPETLVVLRHVDDHWGSYLYADDVDAAARRFIDQFRDSLERNAEWIDYVQDLNEYIACNDYRALRASGPWMEAFCAELERMGYPARPLGFNAGVGNPQHDWVCDEQGIERQVPLMVRGARALAAAGGAFGYHGYHGSRADGFCTLTSPGGGDGMLNRVHFSMRSLLSQDPVFLAHGVEVDHIISECGAIYYDHTYGMPNAGAGWRWPDTMGGDADRYIEELLVLNSYYRAWNAENNNRLLAAIIFLYGGHEGWRYFDLEGEFAARLADALEGLGGE